MKNPTLTRIWQFLFYINILLACINGSFALMALAELKLMLALFSGLVASTNILLCIMAYDQGFDTG